MQDTKINIDTSPEADAHRLRCLVETVRAMALGGLGDTEHLNEALDMVRAVSVLEYVLSAAMGRPSPPPSLGGVDIAALKERATESLSDVFSGQQMLLSMFAKAFEEMEENRPYAIIFNVHRHADRTVHVSTVELGRKADEGEVTEAMTLATSGTRVH